VEGDDASSGSFVDRSAVIRITSAVASADARWQEGTPHDFGGLTWKPDLEQPPDDEHALAVLHVHLAERLRPYIAARLIEAAGAGADVHLAVEVQSLYDEAFLTAVVVCNPLIHLIRSHGPSAGDVRVEPALALLTCLAMSGIRVQPATRKSIARAVLDVVKARTGTAFARGRRFEGLILFLLSQTDDFRVVEHNLRTAAEEIDGVVQQLSTSGRAWSSDRPYILIEGKDHVDPVDQSAVSLLRIKVSGRRPVTKLGILFSSGTFTGDARKQELRFTLDEATIVMASGVEIVEWIDADDPDSYLEALVRRAQLD
jgi:hypothetical protein